MKLWFIVLDTSASVFLKVVNRRMKPRYPEDATEILAGEQAKKLRNCEKFKKSINTEWTFSKYHRIENVIFGLC